MPDLTKELTQIPVGPLGIIALPGCELLAKKVDDYIVSWRKEQQSEHKHTIAFSGYQKDSYLLNASFHRFGTGEGKAVIHESVRGYDIYIVVDVFNYFVGYRTKRVGSVPINRIVRSFLLRPPAPSWRLRRCLSCCSPVHR